MSRSTRNSKEYYEPKVGKQTPMLPISPVRRSSRIKQIKYLPDSESDSNSVNSTTVTSDVFEKKLRSRKISISSDISELDSEMPQTPTKRVTRKSSSALISTPTRITRATSKRLSRATSELQSPSISGRVTRSTRASSVDPEYLSNQQKNQFDSPVKTQKLSSTLSSSSLAKEQESKERIPYVRLDSTIVETDEDTTPRNSDSSLNIACSSQSKKIKKRQITDVEIQSYNNEENKSTFNSSKNEGEVLQPSQMTIDETQTEYMNNVSVKNIFTEEQRKRDESPLLDVGTTADEVFIYSSKSSSQNSTEERKTEKENESLPNIEKSLVDMCESTNVLGNTPTKLLNISTQEQKNDNVNKILNSTINMSLEGSTQQPATPSSSVNKSFDKKKTIDEELSTDCYSRKSTEIAIEHDDTNLSQSVEVTSNSQKDMKKMDISVEFLKSVPTSTTSKTIFSQRDSTKLVNEDETSTEENTQDTNNELSVLEVVKVDKKRKSLNLIHFSQDDVDDSTESSILIANTHDNNEPILIQDKNEVSSNNAHSPLNKSSNDQTNVIQDPVGDSSKSADGIQKNLTEHITELTPKSSNIILENKSESTCSNNVTEDDQSSDTETSKEIKMNTFSEKIDAKDELAKEIVKQNLKQKSTDKLKNLNIENDSSQMKINQKENVEITDCISDTEGINLFQDIPIDKYKEKKNVKTDSIQPTLSSVEVENDNESECDFVLVDKRAWLAAESIKESQEAELYECDSDDTLILKSRLDAAEENTKMNSIIEETATNSSEDEERFKKRRSRTKKRFASEVDQDSFTSTENEDNLVTVNKSSNESKTVLNQSNNKFITNLNKSVEPAEIEEQSSKTDEERDKEEIENDINKLNRNSLTNKKNTSLRKSLEKRTSLNKSLKDLVMQNVSANQSQINDSDEEFDNTDTNAKKELYKKNQSLKKLHMENADDNATKSEKENISFKDSDKNKENSSLNRSINQNTEKKLKDLENNESDNSSMSIVAMNFDSKTSSMIVYGRSSTDEDDERDIPSYLFKEANSDSHSINSDISTDCNLAGGKPAFSDEDDERDIPSFIFAEANSDSHSINSDINKEYNLAGVTPKFSDEDVSADECRTSEEELSDSDDDGLDLADFIVQDDEIEEEEDDSFNDTEQDTQDDVENDAKDIHNMKDKDKNKQKCKNVKEKDKITYKKQPEDKDNKQTYIDKDSIDTENKNEKDNEDGQEKHFIAKRKKDKKKSKFIGIETISYPSTSKNSKMLNSDLSIKKKKNKSLTNENNITSSSIHKKKTSILQHSSPDKSKDLSTRSIEDACRINEKKKKKNKKKQNTSKENIMDEPLAKDTVKSKALKKKKSAKFTELTVASDNILEDVYHISEKKKKKQNTSMENIDKALSENTAKENISKKKKRVKFTQLTTGDDNIPQDAIQTKKKKKKQDLSIEDSIAITSSQDVIKPKISKKKKSVKLTPLTMTDKEFHEDVTSKKQKKRKSDILQEHIDDNVENAMELQHPKKKKRVKFTQLTSELTSKKQKKRKSDVFKENIDESFDDAIELKHPKKKKRTEFIQSSILENTDEDVYKINERKKKQKLLKNIEEILSKDVTESNIPKKKKSNKLKQLVVMENNTCENDYLVNKKKKKREVSKEKSQLDSIQDNSYESTDQVQKKQKKKKKKINTFEGEDKNENEEDVLQKNICERKTDLAQQKNKNKTLKVVKLKSVLNKPVTKKKLTKKEATEGIKKIKKNKNILPVQIPVSKLKSEENILLPNKLSPKTTSNASKSKKVKNLNKRAAEISIPKEIRTEEKSKRKRDRPDDNTENAINMNVPTKKLKKRAIEITQGLPSTSGLKLLPQDVIDNLSDVPLKAKKRQKILQNEKQVKPSVKKNKSKAITTDTDNSLKADTSDCTTQFNLMNIKNIKKQVPKGFATTASFRQRMLDRNDREPISTYLMFRDKKKVG